MSNTGEVAKGETMSTRIYTGLSALRWKLLALLESANHSEHGNINPSPNTAKPSVTPPPQSLDKSNGQNDGQH